MEKYFADNLTSPEFLQGPLLYLTTLSAQHAVPWDVKGAIPALPVGRGLMLLRTSTNAFPHFFQPLFNSTART